MRLQHMLSRAKIDIFDHPSVVWRPLSSEPPRNFRINVILPESRVIRLHLRRWQYGSDFIHIFVVGSESERCTCFEAECIMAFKVIQGRWFWHQSKMRTRLAIDHWASTKTWSYLYFLSFRDFAGFLLRTATPALFHSNFGGVPLGLDCRCCGSKDRRL